MNQQLFFSPPPREIFKTAILTNAYEIILVHNHPSGDPIPSTEDKLITNKLVQVGKLHQIPVWDAMIIGEGYFSFFEYEK